MNSAEEYYMLAIYALMVVWFIGVLHKEYKELIRRKYAANKKGKKDKKEDGKDLWQEEG